MSNVLSWLVFIAICYLLVTVFMALRHLRQGRVDTAQVLRANGWLAAFRQRNWSSRITFYIIPIGTFVLINWPSGLWMCLGTAAIWFYGTRVPPARDRI